jgi:pimeloyl-ACP methyl ester carboxylesterase
MAMYNPVTVAGFPGWFVPAQDRRSGTPILLLHGSFSHHEHFSNYLGYFATAGYDCYAISRRVRLGDGLERAQGIRFRDYLEDTLCVINELGAAPIVVGHSLGGLLAQKVAELGRCRAAVLLNTTPPGMFTVLPPALLYFVPLLPAILRGRPFKPSRSTFSQLAFNKLDPWQIEELLATMVVESGIVFRQMMAGAIRVDRSRVNCPVLCLRGIEDRIISSRLVRLAARQTGACLEEIPNLGHWVMGGPGWEVVTRRIVDWLDEGGF